MNVERWVAKRKPVWLQLEELLRQVDRSGLPSLGRDELQKLGRLYRSVSADLSRARAINLNQDVLLYLNNLTVKAHNQVYQRKKNRWLDFFNFFYTSFPRMVRENIFYVLTASMLFLWPTFACWDFEAKDVNFGHMEVVPGHALLSDEMYSIIEQHKMWTDQTADKSPLFASLISTNNIRCCILAFAFGITFGVGTVFVLFMNGMNFGTVLGACQHYGLLHNILTFVVGHGSLELPAIFISGGAGLLIARSMLFPGQLTRSDSIRTASRSALGMFGGCVPMLLIAGTIESFISPRTDLSYQWKILVGVAAFICLLLYLFIPRRPLGPASVQASDTHTPS